MCLQNGLYHRGKVFSVKCKNQLLRQKYSDEFQALNPTIWTTISWESVLRQILQWILNKLGLRVLPGFQCLSTREKKFLFAVTTVLRLWAL